MKANHNSLVVSRTVRTLFLIEQKYKNESKSQLENAASYFLGVVPHRAKIQK